MANKKIQLKDKDGNNLYPELVKQCILDIVYPIGSVYISIKNTNPGTLFGGTWTQIKDGFLYCTTNTSGDTGKQGNLNGDVKTAGHKLTTNEMPAHQHYTAQTYGGGGSGRQFSVGITQSARVTTAGDYWWNWTDWAGGNVAHDHKIPYTSVYVFKRTA